MIDGKEGKAIDILLVEDNPGDARLAREALKDSKIRNQLFFAGDGEEALDFLYKRGKHSSAPRPELTESRTPARPRLKLKYFSI